MSYIEWHMLVNTYLSSVESVYKSRVSPIMQLLTVVYFIEPYTSSYIYHIAASQISRNVTVALQFYNKTVFPIPWQRSKYSHTVPEPVTGFIGLWACQKHRLPPEKHLRITVWRFDVYITFWPLLSLWLWHLWPLLTAGCAIIRDWTIYDKCLILLKIKLKFLRIVFRCELPLVVFQTKLNWSGVCYIIL